MSGLESYTSAQLVGEIERRRQKSIAEAEPAFRCPKCGAVAKFFGSFSPARFQNQALAFAKIHENCVIPADLVISALFNISPKS